MIQKVVNFSVLFFFFTVFKFSKHWLLVFSVKQKLASSFLVKDQILNILDSVGHHEKSDIIYVLM